MQVTGVDMFLAIRTEIGKGHCVSLTVGAKVTRDKGIQVVGLGVFHQFDTHAGPGGLAQMEKDERSLARSKHFCASITRSPSAIRLYLGLNSGCNL